MACVRSRGAVGLGRVLSITIVRTSGTATSDRGRHRRGRRANLAAVWPNYQRYGVRFLVLARVVVDRSELVELQACIPRSHWTVCRISAPEALVAERLRAREPGTAQEFLVRVSPELAAEMAAEAIEDILVANDERSLTDVANEVLHEWQSRLPTPGA